MRNFQVAIVRFFIWVFVFGSLFAGGRAHAQSGEGANDFSLYLGYLLPNQIEGVTEVMPLFGARYAFGVQGVGSIELDGLNIHSQGVDFTTAGLSLRGEVPLTYGLSALVYGGPDFHYYIPAGETARHSDYGVHFGIAGLILVNDALWLRADLKFMGNPGTGLLLLFGLMFR